MFALLGGPGLLQPKRIAHDATRTVVAAVGMVAVGLAACGGGGGPTTTTTTARGTPATTAPPVTVVINGPVDTFGPPNATLVLGAALGEPAWKAVTGTWGVVDQQAYVRSPVPGRNLAVIDVGQPDGAAQVTLASAANQAGLVFRYQDPRDYWAVVDVPYYGTWAIDLVQDGRARAVANTGLSAVRSGTQVGVVLNGPTIQVVVNSRVMRTVSNPALDNATMVGMTVDGPDAPAARFAEFHFPPPAPSPVTTTSTSPGRRSGQGQATTTTSPLIGPSPASAPPASRSTASSTR